MVEFRYVVISAGVLKLLSSDHRHRECQENTSSSKQICNITDQFVSLHVNVKMQGGDACIMTCLKANRNPL